DSSILATDRKLGTIRRKCELCHWRHCELRNRSACVHIPQCTQVARACCYDVTVWRHHERADLLGVISPHMARNGMRVYLCDQCLYSGPVGAVLGILFEPRDCGCRIMFDL